jgi:hypothetical protein
VEALRCTRAGPANLINAAKASSAYQYSQSFTSLPLVSISNTKRKWVQGPATPPPRILMVGWRPSHNLYSPILAFKSQVD